MSKSLLFNVHTIRIANLAHKGRTDYAYEIETGLYGSYKFWLASFGLSVFCVSSIPVAKNDLFFS
jgi:hypothetical protein